MGDIYRDIYIYLFFFIFFSIPKACLASPLLHGLYSPWWTQAHHSLFWTTWEGTYQLQLCCDKWLCNYKPWARCEEAQQGSRCVRALLMQTATLLTWRDEATVMNLIRTKSPWTLLVSWTLSWHCSNVATSESFCQEVCFAEEDHLGLHRRFNKVQAL